MEKNKKFEDGLNPVMLSYAFNTLFYKKTRNPIFLWVVYQLCRKENITMPEWVYEYIDNCADKILIDKDPKDKAASLCYEALGFKSKGPGTSWKKAKNEVERWNAYLSLKDEEAASPESSRAEILGNTINKLTEESDLDENTDIGTINRWKQDIMKTFEPKEIDAVFDEILKLFPKV